MSHTIEDALKVLNANVEELNFFDTDNRLNLLDSLDEADRKSIHSITGELYLQVVESATPITTILAENELLSDSQKEMLGIFISDLTIIFPQGAGQRKRKKTRSAPNDTEKNQSFETYKTAILILSFIMTSASQVSTSVYQYKQTQFSEKQLKNYEKEQEKNKEEQELRIKKLEEELKRLTDN